MDALNSIELILKTPNQQIDDIQLKCNEEWTVRMLKDHLQNVYPSKPKSSSQRLIYLGKLLQDHVILKEVFNVSIQMGLGVKTLHIVCSELIDGIQPTKTASETSSAPVSLSSTSPSPSASTITATDNTDGLRYRGPTTPISSFSSTQNQTPFTSSMQYGGLPHTNGNMNPQQYQQLWSQQYQMQFQQYYMHMQQWQQAMATGQNYERMLQGSFSTPLLPQTPTTPNTPSTPGSLPPMQQNEEAVQQPQPQAVNNNNNVNQPQQQQQQQPRNQQMNAGPGGAIMQADNGDNEENEGNRDWLDVLYMSLRALMLLSIVYFYSSTTRFVMVAILGFIVYLYQGGWFTPRRVQEPEPVEALLPQENRDEVDNANNSSSTNENDNDNIALDGEQNSSTVLHQPPPPPPRPSVFKIFCTFVVSFVTSLIPTAPPALQQN